MGLKKDALDEALDNYDAEHGDLDTDDTDDDVGDGGQSQQQQKPQQQKSASQQQGQQQAQGQGDQHVPVSALKAVRKELQHAKKLLEAYQGIGADPKQLAQGWSEYQQWKQQVERYRKQVALAQGDPEAHAERLREQLEQVDPRLKKLDRIDTLDERLARISAREASLTLRELLKEHGIEVSAKLRDSVEDYLLLQMDEEQRERLYSGDPDVVREVFEEEMENEEGMLALLKAKVAAAQAEGQGGGQGQGAGGKTPPAPPKRAGVGGNTPPKPGESKVAKTFEETVAAGWDMLSKS